MLCQEQDSNGGKFCNLLHWNVANDKHRACLLSVRSRRNKLAAVFDVAVGWARDLLDKRQINGLRVVASSKCGGAECLIVC